ncbi:hypothetical protein D3C83_264940 [compost metagenome]
MLRKRLRVENEPALDSLIEQAGNQRLASRIHGVGRTRELEVFLVSLQQEPAVLFADLAGVGDDP